MELAKKIESCGYQNALREVLNTRLYYKKIYADVWREEPDWMLFAHLKNKSFKIENLINKDTKEAIQTKINTTIDITNYSLFLLENNLRKLDEMK